MNDQCPTSNPQIDRDRVLYYAKRTHERIFTPDDVAVQFLTLAQIVKARLLVFCPTLSDEDHRIFYLPAGYARRQEMEFCKELIQIRVWCNSTRKYVFHAREVMVKGWILNDMFFGGILERRGMKYRILWKPLVVRWQQMLKNVQEAGKDETE